MELIKNIQSGHFPHPEFNAYPDLVDYYTGVPMKVPVTDENVVKSRFIPSKWEKMKVFKMAKAIEEGRIKLDKVKPKRDLSLMWDDDSEEKRKKNLPASLPAPKLPLPLHSESYNPPDEYLWDEEEKKKYSEMDPEDRPINYEPHKYSRMRNIPYYDNFIKERFQRCLDLYLAPRALKKRVNIDPNILLPNLPDPKELRPFPNQQCLLYKGNESRVRSISVNYNGQYLLSAAEDGAVRLYEVETTKCLNIWHFNSVLQQIQFNPNPLLNIFAIITQTCLIICQLPDSYGGDLDLMNLYTNNPNTGEDKESEENKKKKYANWDFKHEGYPDCVKIVIQHKFQVKQVAWHYKGDYISTVCPSGQSACVMIHQLSKKKSQQPFHKNKGEVQCVSFHPNKPYIFVATKTHVRVYHLQQQQMVKKLVSGAKWISSIAIHPTGDHVIIGSYDKRVCWFDLDLSATPYKTLKYHKKAVRSVAFHQSYPLMASASDDGTIHIFHSMVYSDYNKNPFIVPVKVLKGHEVVGDVGVLDIQFHPRQPWIFTSGADRTIRLYQSNP